MAKKLSVGAKLILMGCAISMIGVVIGLVGLFNINSMNKSLDKMYETNLLSVMYASRAYAYTLRYRIFLGNHVIAETKADMDAAKNDMDIREKGYRDTIEIYRVLNISKDERTKLSEVEKNFDDFKRSSEEILQVSAMLKTQEAMLLLNGSNLKIYQILQANLDELTKMSELKAEQASKAAHNLFVTSVILILVAIILGFLISMALAYGISQGITRPVTRIVSNLSESSSQIAISSNQLSESSQEIANGATEQAASIEETTSSMEELASMVRQNVENAKEASLLAGKSSEASEVGFTQMERMLESMNEISKSSDEIKTVIDVIDDIAFQTNMLALNAAVEAARAGEAGMGFAVVADEVKNLANRSAESAKETAKMVKEIMVKIEQGLDISRKMAEIFKEILTNSKKVSEMSKEVESASRQQDTGISQVNKAIMQFDSVVQANAGSSEETASAAEELLTQVETLNEVVKDLYLIVTGQEFIIKEQKKMRKIEKKKSRQTGTAIKKTKLLAEPESDAEDDDEPEGNNKTRHKISFENDEEFTDIDGL